MGAPFKKYHRVVEAFQWQPGMDAPMVKVSADGLSGTIRSDNWEYDVRPGTWVVRDPICRGFLAFPDSIFKSSGFRKDEE